MDELDLLVAEPLHERHVLIRHRDEAGMDRRLVGVAPVEPGQLLVLATPDAHDVPSLVSALPTLLADFLDGIETVWVGVAGLAESTAAVEWLAEELGAEIVAPDGGVAAMPGAALYAGHSAGGTGWYAAGELLGARFPRPDWESWVPDAPVEVAGVTGVPVPCGLAVGGDAGFEVPVNQRFPKLVVGAPVPPEAVAALLGGLPDLPIMLVPANPEVATHTWTAELAMRLARDVVFSAGTQVRTRSGALSTIVPDADGNRLFRPFPLVLQQNARGGDQEVLDIAAAPPGWERDGRRLYRLADGGPVIADVVPSGLVLRAADGTPADPAADAAPFDPEGWTLTLGMSGHAVGRSVLAAAEDLLTVLPAEQRAVVRVRLAGVMDTDAEHALDRWAGTRKRQPAVAPASEVDDKLPGRGFVVAPPEPAAPVAGSGVPAGRGAGAGVAPVVPAFEPPVRAVGPAGEAHQPLAAAPPAVPAAQPAPAVPVPLSAAPPSMPAAPPAPAASAAPSASAVPAALSAAPPSVPAAPPPSAASAVPAVQSVPAVVSAAPPSAPATPAVPVALSAAPPAVPAAAPSAVPAAPPAPAASPAPAALSATPPAVPAASPAPAASAPPSAPAALSATPPAVPAAPPLPAAPAVPVALPAAPPAVSPVSPPVSPVALPAGAPPVMTMSGAPVSTVSGAPSPARRQESDVPVAAPPIEPATRQEAGPERPPEEAEATRSLPPPVGGTPPAAPVREPEPRAMGRSLTVPARASTAAEQARFTAAAGESFTEALATVNAAMATWPSIRMDESPGAKADYVAVCLFLGRGDGGAGSVNGAVRVGQAGVLDGQVPCLMSGIRRLPTHRRAVLRQGKVNESLEHVSTPGTVLTEPGFLAGSIELDVTVPGADLDVLIWPSTARRTSELMLARPVDEAVFLAGARFKALAMRTAEEKDDQEDGADEGDDTPVAPRVAVLYRELAPGETPTTAELDERDLAVLAKLDGVLARRHRGSLRLVEDPDVAARLTTSMVVWQQQEEAAVAS